MHLKHSIPFDEIFKLYFCIFLHFRGKFGRVVRCKHRDKGQYLPPNLNVTLEKREEKMWSERFKSWILWHIQNCYSFTMPMTMAEMKCALLLNSKYTNSLVNADSFYANFTNATFQKILSPHLTCTMKQKFLH